MKQPGRCLSVALLCVLVAVAPAIGDEDPIEALLRTVQIDPRDVGIQTNELALFVGRRPRSEFVHLLMSEPLRADELAGVVAGLVHIPNAEVSEQKQPIDLLGTMSRFNSRVLRRGLVGDPLKGHRAAAKEERALEKALTKIGGKNLSRSKMDDLPASVQEAAALLVLAATDAAKWVERSREPAMVLRQHWEHIEKQLAEPLKTGAEEDAEEGQDPDGDLLTKHLLEQYEPQLAMVAAQDLMFAVTSAVELLKADDSLSNAKFYLSIRTDLGFVVLADSRPTKHDPGGPVLLILDVGGDDTYANAGANGDAKHPVGIAIDLAGNDTYQAEPNQWGSFGAGVLGVGILWDEAGNDTYDADRRSQGAGEFGVGVLIDNGGDDSYKSIDASQAAATAGFGLLIDSAGDDRYVSHRSSQAYAGPNAAALLVDRAGNDEYVADDADIRYPAPQSDQHNVSMCQAAANGWRADYVDGISVNGGMAVLLDAAGDDKYSCGVFGQGVGYWYGAGLLIDLDGDDEYLGQWYVQGASAHFAAGLLFDRAGDDTYTAHMNMSQGAGHDIGIGVFVDDAGDDTYIASTLGLGASNAAGVGVFVDKAGDDTYQTPSTSCLGWVNPNGGYRALFRAYGLFFDLAGSDTYTGRDGKPGRDAAADGAAWTTPANESSERLRGFAFDR